MLFPQYMFNCLVILGGDSSWSKGWIKLLEGNGCAHIPTKLHKCTQHFVA